MAAEVEIKLAFEPEYKQPQINALEHVLKELNFNSGLSSKLLENAYFDTADFQLNKHKVALRIRKKMNEQGLPIYIQTFKTAGSSENGLSKRGEWEWSLPSNILNLSVLKNHEAWPESIAIEKLVKVFETNFTRYSAELKWKESTIEVVLDWGLILSNGCQEQIHEIEIELLEGSAEDLICFSERLKSRLNVSPLDISKAERGFSLFQQN